MEIGAYMTLATTMQLVIGAMVFISLFITNPLGDLRASSPTLAVVGSEDSLSAIFDNVSNSVVQIVSVIPPLFNLNPQAQNTTEVGAGFIYDDAGHIVTGNHVLA